MGDRVSIQFKGCDGRKSAILYSHWDGMDLVKMAKEYVEKLRSDNPNGAVGNPLDRMEGDSVMFNFVYYLSCHRIKDVYKKGGHHKEAFVACDHNYRLMTHETGDDNGHHVIDCVADIGFLCPESARA